MYEMAIFDHLPLSVIISLRIPSVSITTRRTSQLIREMVDWKNFDRLATEEYNSTVLASLHDTFL